MPMTGRLSRRQYLRAGAVLTLAGGRVLDAMAQAVDQPRQQPLKILSQIQPPVDPLRLPRDHGAHLDSRVEWWSLKGELHPSANKSLGFHLSFIRSQVESAAESKSRFAPRHVIAARASLSNLDQKQHWYDQRVARLGFGLADMAEDDLRIVLHDWSLQRSGNASGAAPANVFQGRIVAKDFQLDLRCQQTMPPLVHGEGGVLHRDPLLGYPTRYHSMVQLKVDGSVSHKGGRQNVSGKAWLDHGWGRRMMSPDAIGSDWLCMNLNDGGALVVFRMRRSDGTAAWSGAALRKPGRPDQVFQIEDVKMTPGKTWRSPASGAQYPVSWEIELAGTRYSVRARMNEQEVDGGNEIGDVFWEGLSDLLDAQGKLIGAGYLEMTGYAAEISW
jgi:predicted secreted hydrolase